MNKPNLVLMRHGQSLTNSGTVVHNERQNILTPKGISDNIRLANTFRHVFPDLQFDHSFVSPLPRAMQTHFNFLSTIENRAIDTEIEERFIERHLGFEGFLTIQTMIARYGQDVVNSWELNPDVAPGTNGEGGESLRDVYDRVVFGYQELIVPRLRDGQTILLTAHYYVLKVLQSHLLYGDVSKAPLFDPRNSLPVPYRVEI
jgi:2,3-bisphosphoglycerate-dependent phosphoglycerate mutase